MKKWSGKKITLTISAYIVGLLFISPYIEMILTSLKPKNEITSIPTTYLPHKWEWANYKNIWHQITLGVFLKNSIIISLISTLLVILISVPAAYYVARNNFRGRTAFMLLVLVTQMFSPTALVIGI